MKLTAYLHLVPRSTVGGAVPPSAHMPSCHARGKTLLLLLLNKGEGVSALSPVVVTILTLP